MNATESLPNDVMVEIINLTCQSGGQLVLQNVYLSVYKGKVCGVYGPNGAGKTALLQVAVGLRSRVFGTVRVLDKDPDSHPVEVRLRCGYLPQEDSLPDDLCVRDLFRYLQGIYPTWDASYVNVLMRAFALDWAACPCQLSKGQRMQVQLIAVVAHHPCLLILDSPTVVLDSHIRDAITDEIIPTLLDHGGAVLLASHLFDEIERMSDYVVTLDKGKVTSALDIDEWTQEWHGISAASGNQSKERGISQQKKISGGMN